MNAPAGRCPLAPLGAWLLGALALLTAWLLAAPLLLPGVVVLGGIVLLGSCCTQLARLWLGRYWSSAGLLRPGPADAPPPVLRPAAGQPAVDVRVAWRCAYRSCQAQGWAESAAGAYIADELHTVCAHPGQPALWQIVGATMPLRVGAA